MSKEKIIAKDEKHLQILIKKEIQLNGNECDLNYIDVSNVEDMSYMFFKTNFKGNISQWDVSNVKSMNSMFEKSKFNGDISKWNISKVENMNYFFYNSEFNNDISGWDVKNVKSMSNMFRDSNFTGDISSWNVSNVVEIKGCFESAKMSPWWDIEDYEERQSEINKRKLNKMLQCSMHKKKIKV